MFKKYSLFLFFIYALSSCVPHKDIVYFQGDSLSENDLRELNNKPYRLHVDDILSITIKAPNQEMVSVFKNASSDNNNNQNINGQNYFSGYSVDKQGFIEVPYLGSINVLGFTTSEIETEIEKGLKKYFKSLSEIFVSVKLAGFKYTIVGEIGSSGTKILFQNTVNIVEAVANAGDIAITGDKTNIEILRVGINGVQKFHIDLTQIASFNSEIFYIQPNDIINVPPIKQKTLGTGVIGTQTFTTIMSILSVLTTSFLLIKAL